MTCYSQKILNSWKGIDVFWTLSVSDIEYNLHFDTQSNVTHP